MFVLLLGVVGGFVAVSVAAIVVAVVQQVILHHGDGVLSVQAKTASKIKSSSRLRILIAHVFIWQR